MNIRLAGRGDLDALTGLLHELFRQEAEFTPDAKAQRRGLEAILASGDAGRLLVSDVAGDVVAMVTLLYVPSTALGARVALLEDMIVSKDHRCNGIGGALLGAAIAQARSDGCARITLLSDGDNHRAHGFYERAGFRRSKMAPFRLPLPP